MAWDSVRFYKKFSWITNHLQSVEIFVNFAVKNTRFCVEKFMYSIWILNSLPYSMRTPIEIDLKIRMICYRAM